MRFTDELIKIAKAIIFMSALAVALVGVALLWTSDVHASVADQGYFSQYRETQCTEHSSVVGVRFRMVRTMYGIELIYRVDL